MSRFPPLFRSLAVAGLTMLAACDGGPADRPGTLPDTSKRVHGTLPAGRFQLPTRHTPVPDFYITLPTGYRIRDVGRMPNDEYYIIRSDDPSLTDTAALTPGYLRFYVGVNAETWIDSGVVRTNDSIMLDGQPVLLKRWTEQMPNGAPYFNREISSSNFFVSRFPSFAKYPLNIHVYAGGLDSTRVGELMTAARTLSLKQ
ncbi:MAG: hypothetical protein ABI876_07085 [Bacteroidota bacterium]